MLPQDEITARVRRLRVIWLALMFSVATFYLVVWFLLKRSGATEFRAIPGLVPAAGIVAAILLLAPIIRRRLEAAPRTAGPEEIASRWATGWLVGQAIKEAVGILGLVIALLAGSTSWALGFAIASVASMIMTPPWEHEVRLRIHRAEQQRGAVLGG